MSQIAFSVRMDSRLKEEFSAMCDAFGMPVSTAINLFAKAVVREQRVPFEIRADMPNDDTRRVFELAEAGKELNGPFSSMEELRKSLDA